MLRPFTIRWHALDLGDPDFDPGRSPPNRADLANPPPHQTRDDRPEVSSKSRPDTAASPRLLWAGLFGERRGQRGDADRPVPPTTEADGYSLPWAARLTSVR